MSHVSECVALYRFDTLVSHEQYGKLIEDAYERDLADEARAEAPDPEPEPEPDAEPALAAAYILKRWDQLVSTIEAIGEAVRLLDDLDTKRARDVADLTEAVDLLVQRMDLRAEECRALNARIENVTRLAASTRALRSVTREGEPDNGR